MEAELKERLVNIVKSATAVLNEGDALEIVEICKRASEREIANVTEEYLAECIAKSGDADPTGGDEEC